VAIWANEVCYALHTRRWITQRSNICGARLTLENRPEGGLRAMLAWA